MLKFADDLQDFVKVRYISKEHFSGYSLVFLSNAGRNSLLIRLRHSVFSASSPNIQTAFYWQGRLRKLNPLITASGLKLALMIKPCMS